MSDEKFVEVQVGFVGERGYRKVEMTREEIEDALENISGIEIVYWEGMNRITRVGKIQPGPTHTRAAYVRFRTPRLRKVDNE